METRVVKTYDVCVCVYRYIYIYFYEKGGKFGAASLENIKTCTLQHQYNEGCGTLPPQQLWHKHEPEGVQAGAGGQDIGHIVQPDEAENVRQELVRELKERARHFIGPVCGRHGCKRAVKRVKRVK